MYGRLVEKELLSYLLDRRFLAVCGLCVILSGLSVYAGSRNYSRQLEEYDAVSESNRQSLETYREGKRISFLVLIGYKWNRRPEVLSPIVFGLSGSVGREVLIRYQRLMQFEGSIFETDPIHQLFGVLDMAFIVKVVLSLTVLLFTYDAVCGEKQDGTLRLCGSFPVARSTLALAKITGSTIAMLVPFVLTYLLAVAIVSLMPGVGLSYDDIGRLAALMVVFGIYLGLYAAFGLWVSALSHRRVTAFLGAVGLWAIWTFALPSLALDLAGRIVPADSFYKVQNAADQLRRDRQAGIGKDSGAYWDKNRVNDWSALSEVERQRALSDWRAARYDIESAWDARHLAGVRDRQVAYRNQLRAQLRVAAAMSAASPLGALTFVSMDLARTGHLQQERIEDALNTYLGYLGQYVREKNRESDRGEADMSDVSLFDYRFRDPLGESLARNALPLTYLVLLAVLGFAGAYVSILRYDVR